MDWEQVAMDLLRQDPPTISLEGEVNKQMFEHLGKCLIVLKSRGSPQVQIEICSGGGHVTWGLDIYDMLRLYKGKKTALVLSEAASMAAVFLQACEVRHATRHAAILIHHVSRSQVSLDTLDSAKALKETLDDMRKKQVRLYQILAARTGKQVGTIRTVCRKDKYMTSEEALAFGLIDEIV